MQPSRLLVVISQASVLILLLTIVPLLAVSGCKHEEPKSEQVLTWQPVATWSGDGNTQTESFTSQTGTFKFTWESKSLGPQPGFLRIMLHSAVSGRPLVQAVERTGDGKDSIYVNEDPREFYVVVEARGTHWTLTVDEGINLILTPSKR